MRVANERESGLHSLEVYKRSIGKFKSIKRKEALELARQWQEEDNIEARDKLIHSFTKLPFHYINRCYRDVSIQFKLDLIAEANAAIVYLFQSKKIDLSRGCVAAYVYKYIEGYIKIFVDKSHMIYMSRNKSTTRLAQNPELVDKIIHASTEKEYNAAIEELRLKGKIHHLVETIKDQIRWQHSGSKLLWLDKSVTFGNEVPGRSNQHEIIADTFDTSSLVGHNLEMERVIEATQVLTEQEKFILQQHFIEEETFASIAKVLGVSRQRVNEIENTALRKIRSVLGVPNDKIPHRRSRK